MEHVERMAVTFLTAQPHSSRATVTRFLANVHGVSPRMAEAALSMAVMHNYVRFSAAEFASLEPTGLFDPDERESVRNDNGGR